MDAPVIHFARRREKRTSRAERWTLLIFDERESTANICAPSLTRARMTAWATTAATRWLAWIVSWLFARVIRGKMLNFGSVRCVLTSASNWTGNAAVCCQFGKKDVATAWAVKVATTCGSDCAMSPGAKADDGKTPRASPTAAYTASRIAAFSVARYCDGEREAEGRSCQLELLRKRGGSCTHEQSHSG